MKLSSRQKKAGESVFSIVKFDPFHFFAIVNCKSQSPFRFFARLALFKENSREILGEDEFMIQLPVENRNVIQTFGDDYLNKKSIVSMCYLLANYCLQTCNLEYQSLKYLKMKAANQFSKRSVDSFVKNLVRLGVLQKLPRKKQQSYRLQLNHPLLRFILMIYYPEGVFEINKPKPQISNLSMLQIYKKQLDTIFSFLLDCESHLLSISDEFFDIIDSVDEFTKELESQLFWSIMGSNSSDKLMKIITEFNHTGLEDD